MSMWVSNPIMRSLMWWTASCDHEWRNVATNWRNDRWTLGLSRSWLVKRLKFTPLGSSKLLMRSVAKVVRMTSRFVSVSAVRSLMSAICDWKAALCFERRWSFRCVMKVGRSCRNSSTGSSPLVSVWVSPSCLFFDILVSSLTSSRSFCVIVGDSVTEKK